METYTTKIDGKEVIFEAGEMGDNHGHVRDYLMTGYTDGIPTHTAIGTYTFFDEFVDINEIEEIKN